MREVVAKRIIEMTQRGGQDRELSLGTRSLGRLCISLFATSGCAKRRAGPATWRS